MTQGPAEQPSRLNIANVLTVIRIVGVPVFGWLLLTESGDSIEMRLWAFVAFTLLMVTDRIDGDLARKYDLVTDFGKVADPIADKALTGMAFVGLSIIGVLWWWVTIVLLVREWGITLMRFVTMKHGVTPASRGGKIKTTLQAVAIGGYLLPLELWDSPFATFLLWTTHVVMALALIVTLVTAYEYVRDALRLRAERMRAEST